MRRGASKFSPLLEIARVLVCFNHVARFMVNANHGVPIRLANLARFFQNSAHMKTTTLPLRNLMNRSPLRAFLLIPFALACFALSPTVRAVDPPPDGGYPGFNTAEGDDALFNLDTSQGTNNTAIGFAALLSSTTGISNTAVGFDALYSNTTGAVNTATGSSALFSNTTGTDNTAHGAFALFFNTTGTSNTANGVEALQNNTAGQRNTANGGVALFSNTTANSNTATGFAALFSNNADNNTSNGYQALNQNTTGFNNTADGVGALFSNTTGSNNTADGFQALLNNTTGSFNIAVGNGAGGNLTTGINNVDIGNNGVAGESKTIRIGKSGKQTNTFIAGISGATVPTGVAVIVDASGHLGTTTSSARFKEAIKPMDKASEAILALKPVTFQYKKELDPAGVPQFGLVAENVEKMSPDLVARDEQGKAYTVRYEAVNAMLLNEFLKEHRNVEQLEQQVERLTA